jgi:hypothetical protein
VTVDGVSVTSMRHQTTFSVTCDNVETMAGFPAGNSSGNGNQLARTFPMLYISDRL